MANSVDPDQLASSDLHSLQRQGNVNTTSHTYVKQCRSRSVKPTDLDLHCLQRQGISGFSRTRVKCLELPLIHCKVTRNLEHLVKCMS